MIKFGRVDIWHQSDMASFLPYKFQVFPAVYVWHQGETEICGFKFERPLEGLKACLEGFYGRSEQRVVGDEAEALRVETGGRIRVVLEGKLRANIRVKALHAVYRQYFEFVFV